MLAASWNGNEMTDEFEAALDDIDESCFSQVFEQSQQQPRAANRRAPAVSTSKTTLGGSVGAAREVLRPPVDVSTLKRRKVEEKASKNAANAVVVDPNPFVGRQHRQQQPTAAARPAPAVNKLQEWGQKSVTKPVQSNGPAGSQRPAQARAGSVDPIAQRENEALRKRLDNVLRQLEEQTRRANEKERIATAKAGEATILRNQLNKVQSDLHTERETSHKTVVDLKAQIENQVNSHKKEMEAIKVETVFKKHEYESARPRPASAWKRATTVSPSKQVASSPSAARTARQMTGFTSAFGPQAGPSNKRNDRQDSVLPPQTVAQPKSAKKMLTPDAKGKSRQVDEDDDDQDVDMEDSGVGLLEDTSSATTDFRLLIIEEVLNHLALRKFDSAAAISAADSSYSKASGSTATSSTTHALQTPDHVALVGSAPTPEWMSTMFYLTTVQIPDTVPNQVREDYHAACKKLFVAVGGNQLSTSAKHELDGFETACAVASALEDLSRSLSAAAIVGPLVAALLLSAHLVNQFDQVSMFYLNAIPERPSRFLILLAHLLKRFGRPVAPAASNATGSGDEAAKRMTAGQRRKARASLRDKQERVPAAGEVTLDADRRFALLDAVLYNLRALAFRPREGIEAAFSEFLASQDAVAVLLDPLQPRIILTRSLSFLSQLAARPRLFRALTGAKFYPASDFMDQQLPLIKRVGFILFSELKRREPDPAMFDESFELTMAVLSFSAVLAVQHADALTFITSGFIMTEFINLIATDVHTLWGYSSLLLSTDIQRKLARTVERLAATVELLHFLLLNRNLTIDINETLQARLSFGAYERYSVAFGTMLLAGVPSWVSSEHGLVKMFNKLKHLAGDLLEEQTIEEEEAMMLCYGIDPPPPDEMDVEQLGADDDEEALRQVDIADVS